MRRLAGAEFNALIGERLMTMPDPGRELAALLADAGKGISPSKPFAVWRLKSQIQAELKDYKGAIASAQTSLSKAKEAGNKEFIKSNEDAIAEWSAIK